LHRAGWPFRVHPTFPDHAWPFSLRITRARTCLRRNPPGSAPARPLYAVKTEVHAPFDRIRRTPAPYAWVCLENPPARANPHADANGTARRRMVATRSRCGRTLAAGQHPRPTKMPRRPASIASGCWRSRLPQPAQYVRQQATAVVVRVPALAPHMGDFVTRAGAAIAVGLGIGPLQGGEHLLVGEEPVAVLVVQVVAPVLQENAQPTHRTLADQRGVEVATRHQCACLRRRLVADGDIAADEADHVAEGLRPVPGDGERGDRAAAGATDRAPRRIAADAVLALDQRQ